MPTGPELPPLDPKFSGVLRHRDDWPWNGTQPIDLNRLALSKVIDELWGERVRQHARWGYQNCHDFEWVSILTEEVGEAARAANEANFDTGSSPGDFTNLRAELIQVAAVAVQWVEAIDRRPTTDGVAR